MSDDLTLTINGQIYAGWTKIKVARSLKSAASTFEIEVSDRWGGTIPPQFWQIQLFSSCVVAIAGTPVLTGYVEKYDPKYGPEEHSVSVSGRSRTADLVDCMPDVGTGQFNGYTLDKIARATAAPFGIDVIVQCDVGAAFPQAVLEKTETAHAFLEKLCRMRSVIPTDDANGNLVLCQAGAGGGSASLVEGQNIELATAKLSCDKRFQQYLVLAQAPLGFNGENPQLQVKGEATDSGCPRPRRFAETAEKAADTGEAKARAKWRALHAMAEGTEATITVYGWRQTPGGAFWTINQTAPVNSPMLQLNRPLLVGDVTFLLDREGGRRTELKLAPQEAFTPEPEAVKGGKGSNSIWQGVQKITGS